MTHRIKIVVKIPSEINNEDLSDLIIKEKLKYVAITWLSNTKAVISTEDSITKLRKTCDKLNLELLNEKTHILHDIKNGKESKDVEHIKRWD